MVLKSGAETRTPFAYVVEYEDREAISVRAYLDPGEALEAAGLSESAMSQENAEIVRCGLMATMEGGLANGARHPPS